jgi:hypothetical protein
LRARGLRQVVLLANERNLGFTLTANRGMREARPGSDVLLLNSDTVVTPGWLERSRAAPLPTRASERSLRFRTMPKSARCRAFAPTIRGQRMKSPGLSPQHSNWRPCRLTRICRPASVSVSTYAAR